MANSGLGMAWRRGWKRHPLRRGPPCSVGTGLAGHGPAFQGSANGRRCVRPPDLPGRLAQYSWNRSRSELPMALSREHPASRPTQGPHDRLAVFPCWPASRTVPSSSGAAGCGPCARIQRAYCPGWRAERLRGHFLPCSRARLHGRGISGDSGRWLLRSQGPPLRGQAGMWRRPRGTWWAAGWLDCAGRFRCRGCHRTRCWQGSGPVESSGSRLRALKTGPRAVRAGRGNGGGGVGRVGQGRTSAQIGLAGTAPGVGRWTA